MPLDGNSSMIEVFTCWGEVSLRSSSVENIISKKGTNVNEIAAVDYRYDNNGHSVINLRNFQR